MAQTQRPAPAPTLPPKGRTISLIVIHCSASPNGQWLNVADIDRWHQARGFRRGAEFRKRQNPDLSSIGYHFVIYTNGAIATGRHLNEVGAHVAGNNMTSIGICMVGADQFTPAQWESLKRNLIGLARYLNDARGNPASFAAIPPFVTDTFKRLGVRVCGHRDLSPDHDNDGLVEPWEWLKTCPGFDVAAWLKAGMTPDAKHVLPHPHPGPPPEGEGIKETA